jgi:hypothetical protein
MIIIMVKKTTKKPSKNGTKQKQKQKQTVIVNINNGKTQAKRQPVKPPSKPTQYPQYINTYPVFLQTEPSPPIIYNRPDISSSALKTPVEEQTNISVALKTPKKTPVKKTPVEEKSNMTDTPKKTPVKKTPVNGPDKQQLNITDAFNKTIPKTVEVKKIIKKPKIEASEYTPPSKLSPLELSKLTDFKDGMLEELALSLDKQQREEALKNAQKRKEKTFSYVR